MRFVGVSDIRSIVNHVGVEPLLRLLADRIESDFRRWPEFERAPRLASHSAEGVIELMPTSDDRLYSVKYVNGHPNNWKRGLQTVCGIGLLSDVATGYPVLISEMTLLTALRTGAMSALAARHLARPDSSVMAMIGLGAQSEFQALAFRAICGIDRLRVHDIDPAATAKFVSHMGKAGFDITIADTAGAAALGADIVTTVTADRARATVLSDNMVGGGVHLNAVGGDCPGKTELQAAILKRANVFVELTEQTRIEGEIQQMPADFPVTELWEVITGDKPGRRHADEITLFDSVGFAIEDFSALCLINELAIETGHFTDVDLIANPTDPRNLFGLLADPESVADEPVYETVS